MNSDSYEKALILISEKIDLCDFLGPRPESMIISAENVLNLKLRGAYRDFLLRFGTGNIGSYEIFGITNGEFENSSVPNAVWYTLAERKTYKLPENLFIIYDTGSDELYCLDFSGSKEKEPSVVSYAPGIGIEHQDFRVVAQSFGDFLLEILEEFE